MIVRTPSDFDYALSRLREHNPLVMDLETTGLLPFKGDKIIGWAWYVPATDEGFYLPVRHEPFDFYGDTAGNLDIDIVNEGMVMVLSRSDLEVVMWNGNFDFHFAEKELGKTFEGVARDAMLRWHLHNENCPDYKLKETGERVFGLDAKEEQRAQDAEWARWQQSEIDKLEEELSTGKFAYVVADGEPYHHACLRLHNSGFPPKERLKIERKVLIADHTQGKAICAACQAPIATLHRRAEIKQTVKEIRAMKAISNLKYMSPEVVGEYAIKDCILSWRLHQKCQPSLEKEHLTNVAAQVHEYADAIRAMERRGLQVDRAKCFASKERCRVEAQKLREQVNAAFPGLNPRSVKELRRVVYPGLSDVELSRRKEGRKGLEPVYSTAAVVLLDHPDENVRAIPQFRQWEKAEGTYFQAFLDRMTDDCRLHPSINIHGTVSGRASCIAKGTPIEVVRDVSRYPKGVPIEDVKVGDLAYSYDDDGNLCLRKVLWAGYMGRKKVIRLNWRGTGKKHTGYLDLTPDHRIRRTDGTYVEAQKLKPGDSVMALSRGSDGHYARLYPVGNRPVREQRFIFEQVYGYLPEHVHHDNGNKRDNRVENLIGMTATDHLSYHSSNPSEEIRVKRAETLRRRWIDGTITAKTGSDSPNWLDLPADWMEEALWDHAGHPTVFRDVYGIDYETAKKYLTLHGIDPREIGKYFNAADEAITPVNLYVARQVYRQRGQKAAQEHIRLGYYRFKEMQEAYGFIPYNHTITGIEILDEPQDVYDLTIEETENFIASELSSHNCSQPNLQNIPRGSDIYDVKSVFVAKEGHTLVSSDLSQIELRLTAHYSEDPNMLGVYQEDGDIHQMTADMIGCSRSVAKNVNFGIIYNMGVDGLRATVKKAAKIDLSYDEAERFLVGYKARYPKVARWAERTVQGAKARGYVQLWTGRRRRFVEPWMAKDAVNATIQGGAAEVLRIAIMRLHRKGLPMVMQIHDDILFEIKDEWVDSALPVIREAMQEFQFRVPIKTTIKTGKRWSEMKEIQ